jgi:hypothetical protein
MRKNIKIYPFCVTASTRPSILSFSPFFPVNVQYL